MDDSVGLLVIADRASAGVDRLVSSIERFNTEKLPVSFVGSAADALELVAGGGLDAVAVLDPRLGFVRPFGSADFVGLDGTPHVFASEERERLVDSDADGAEMTRAARDALEVRDPRQLRSRGLSVWSAAEVRAWRDDWLAPRGWTYEDALAFCPDPCAWCLAWRLARGGALEVREPIVAVIDTDARVLDYRSRGITVADLARAYVGVVTPAGTHQWESDERAAVLAQRMSSATLARAVALRTTRKAPRVQRWFGLSR
jgi:hypothetical protein